MRQAEQCRRSAPLQSTDVPGRRQVQEGSGRSNRRLAKQARCVSTKALTVIERIFTRSSADGSTHEHRSVQVVAGAGIEGDRYFDKHDEPGQNVTLIEAEEIERFASAHGRAEDLSITGRNLVTRGVRLNELVGKEFTVGQVRLRGVELCEPCLGLGKSLADASLSPAGVVKSFVHRAGLRADALSTGSISVGAAVKGAN